MVEQKRKSQFLEELAGLEGSAGNQALRRSLDWSEAEYDEVKQTLLAEGAIVSGRGRGGSVRLPAGSESAAETAAPPPPPQNFRAKSDDGSSAVTTHDTATDELASANRTGPPGRTGVSGSGEPVADYRFEDTRKNIPPAKIAAEGSVPDVSPVTYSYSPRLDPRLRFDETGEADRLFEILEDAKHKRLSTEEVNLLVEALKSQEPWLQWASKQENRSIDVDPVALHIHERISAQAILTVAARQDVTRDLFADPQQEYWEAIQFYQHDIDWTNRLILGDSLQVMTSLAEREDLAGKVQMIYFDPPYGIRFGSNFQVDIGDRDSSDREKHLTREPEMIKAYRDTWSLGIHSYLSYLRDRLRSARDLLKESGSIFVQIGDENLPVMSLVLDEIFGRENRVQIIVVKKKSSTQKGHSVVDYLLWYAKDRVSVKMPDVYTNRGLPEDSSKFRRVELPSGERRPARLLSDKDKEKYRDKFVRDDDPISSQHYSPTRTKKIIVQGREVYCGSGRQWTFDVEHGMRRLERADRLRAGNKSASGVVYWGDSRLAALPNVWTDVHGEAKPVYVVQTNRKIVERCILMSTDPGDLVVDPTCGSGTTAFAAEMWGRRWIMIDTSRVAVAIARQRLMTADFDYFELKDPDRGVAGGFKNNTVERITLKSIANNEYLDPILDKHETILTSRLRACNAALSTVTDQVRHHLQAKLKTKQRAEGKKAITDADSRRWCLPSKGKTFEHWTLPFDTDDDWPSTLAETVTAYRTAWREKMDEVNACISSNAEQTELIDKPVKNGGILRVSGPFTVEAVQPPEVSLGDILETPIGGAPEKIEETFVADHRETGPADGDSESRNADAYIHKMMNLLKTDGVRFPDNKQMSFARLDPLAGKSSAIHAEGCWTWRGTQGEDEDGPATVAVAFGPQFGPVTAWQVEQLIRAAARHGYDDLVIAGFSFDGAAQAVIDEDSHPAVRIHMAHIRPDVNPGMEGLLSEQPGAQLFTVFGQPRTDLEGPDDNGEFVVRMNGVDVYNPVDNSITANRSDKVAAWFADTDYDGRTFCITQAFFPDKSVWKKLARSLHNVVDAEVFEILSGTESLPFPPGQYRCVAVKVIDPRGNEVMRVHRLEA